MKKVTKISPCAVNPVEVTGQPKLRVAAYCRVSTDSDEQLGSLETQISHYESYIKANPAFTIRATTNFCGKPSGYSVKRNPSPGL